MHSVCIIQLANLPKATQNQAWDGAKESARIWTDCSCMFHAAMEAKNPWPRQGELQVATKGRYALHSQTVQMVAKSVQVAFANARLLRKTYPEMRMRYPYREKRHYALLWPAQAVSVRAGRVILPMGKGRPELVLPLGRELPFEVGACKVVWKDGWELHVASLEPAEPAASPGNERATGDLGEIHQIALATSTGKALVISGRGIRSAKRRRCKGLAALAAKGSRCKKGSRRHRKLARARRALSRRTRNQIRDLRHKGLRNAVDFCAQEKVDSLYVGNPDGVRRRKAGAVHNGRMARWECGLDLKLIEHKCHKAGIIFTSGTERGSSSHCPCCGNRQRPTGRNFTCRKCGATVHRDVMGAVNQHRIGFGQPVPLPSSTIYLRPGGATRQRAGNEHPAWASSSRPDTGLPENQGQLSCGAGEPDNRFAKTATNVGRESKHLRRRALACLPRDPQESAHRSRPNPKKPAAFRRRGVSLNHTTIPTQTTVH